MLIDAQRLWTAVLMQAVNDLFDMAMAIDTTAQRFRSYAQLWSISGNHEPGRFFGICDHLEFDASSFRRRPFEIADRASASNAVSFANRLGGC